MFILSVSCKQSKLIQPKYKPLESGLTLFLKLGVAGDEWMYFPGLGSEPVGWCGKKVIEAKDIEDN